MQQTQEGNIKRKRSWNNTEFTFVGTWHKNYKYNELQIQMVLMWHEETHKKKTSDINTFHDKQCMTTE